VYPASIDLSDIVAKRVLRRQQVRQGLPRLWLAGDGVVATAPGAAYHVDAQRGAITPMELDEAPKIPAQIADHSQLDELGAAPGEGLAHALDLASARGRELSGGAVLVVGLDRHQQLNVAALMRNQALTWRTALGREPPLGGSVSWNAVANDRHWFIAYRSGRSARLAALDLTGGAVSWDLELARPHRPAQLSVRAMSAGRELVGIVLAEHGVHDKLLLVDAASGAAKYAYQRG
jgi:hypothetical protein